MKQKCNTINFSSVIRTKETWPGVISPFMCHKQIVTFCLFQAAVGPICPSLSHTQLKIIRSWCLNDNVFSLIWLFNGLSPNYHHMFPQMWAGEGTQESGNKRRSDLEVLAHGLIRSGTPLCPLLRDDKFSPWTWCQYVDVPFFIKIPSNW